jgi:DNA-binding NtrC family response regulator
MVSSGQLGLRSSSLTSLGCSLYLALFAFHLSSRTILSIVACTSGVLEEISVSAPFLQPELNKQEEQDANQTWKSTERKMIMEALVKARGRKSKAADLLG